MNNEIEENYCSFEVSGLLKEKGFNCKACNAAYVNSQPDRIYDISAIREGEFTLAPTHALAIEWIRANFYLHIESIMDIPQSGPQDGCFVWNGYVKDDDKYKVKILFKSENKSSTKKAIEAALLYTLKEL